jgi:hypothetical protein
VTASIIRPLDPLVEIKSPANYLVPEISSLSLQIRNPVASKMSKRIILYACKDAFSIRAVMCLPFEATWNDVQNRPLLFCCSRKSSESGSSRHGSEQNSLTLRVVFRNRSLLYARAFNDDV